MVAGIIIIIIIFLLIFIQHIRNRSFKLTHMECHLRSPNQEVKQKFVSERFKENSNVIWHLSFLPPNFITNTYQLYPFVLQGLHV